MTKKPLRCEYCNRRIFGTDFVRGLALRHEAWTDSISGPVCREFVAHTYDCEGAPRRLVLDLRIFVDPLSTEETPKCCFTASL
jgi:hypothetical protein